MRRDPFTALPRAEHEPMRSKPARKKTAKELAEEADAAYEWRRLQDARNIWGKDWCGP